MRWISKYFIQILFFCIFIARDFAKLINRFTSIRRTHHSHYCATFTGNFCNFFFHCENTLVNPEEVPSLTL